MSQWLSLAVSSFLLYVGITIFYCFKKEETMVLIQNKLPQNLVNLYVYRIVDSSKPINLYKYNTHPVEDRLLTRQFLILSTNFVWCYNPISGIVPHLEIMSLFLLHLWQFSYSPLFYYMILSQLIGEEM